MPVNDNHRPSWRFSNTRNHPFCYSVFYSANRAIRKSVYLRMLAISLLVFVLSVSCLMLTGIKVVRAGDFLKESLSESYFIQPVDTFEMHEVANDSIARIRTRYKTTNAANGWEVGFLANGTTRVQPGSVKREDYFIQFKTLGINDIPMSELEIFSAHRNVVSYRWGNGLREWWINTETGLEQWFEISKRPKTAARTSGIHLKIHLDTKLATFIENEALVFTNYSNVLVHYERLLAWDSRGKNLPVSLDLDGQQLVIEVDDSEALYPITIDPVINKKAYMKASNTDRLDEFGWSVGIDGDIAVVGTPKEESAATGVNGNQEDNSSREAGAAYVFQLVGSDWSQTAYLKASNTDALDEFGQTLAVSGNTIAIGAPGEDSSAVGVNGDSADNSKGWSGAVYLFVRSGTQWRQEAYIKASNTDSGDRFGSSVALSGDTLVVGAPWESSQSTGVNGNQNDNSTTRAGAVYVFVRNGATWVQQAYLKSSNTDTDDRFGYFVSIDGDTLAVSAYLESSDSTGVNGPQDNNNARNSGAVYIFERESGQWSQTAYIKASNTESFDFFGRYLALNGDFLAVSAPDEDSQSVGVNGDDTDNSAETSGAVFVFVRQEDGWLQDAYIKSSNTGNGDQFGTSLDLFENKLVVGAPFEDSDARGLNGDQLDGSSRNSGATYFFKRVDGNWEQHAYLKSFNSDEDDQFGQSVAVKSGRLIVGAIGEQSKTTGVNANHFDNSSRDAGAAYIYSIPFYLNGFEPPLQQVPE